MDGSVTTHVNFILVFLEGIFSFFSPCVIPLLPVYMGYLAGNTTNNNEDATIPYNRKKVLLHTVFFVLGISFTFFALGLTFTSLGEFLSKNRLFITRISGILIILMGLIQLGFFDFSFFQKERRFHFKLENKKVNPLVAFLLGFTFSFAWTPCIGPALSSVLLMASGAKTSLIGYLLVLVYTAGFVIPFLLLGFFTTEALDFLKRKKKFLRYTIKIAGVVLILIGLMTFTGFMNGVSNYLNSYTPKTSTEKDNSTSKGEKEASSYPGIDFNLYDQYGKKHTLSEYKGKVVFLNFWATWCPPCNKELPDIEELYKEYNSNKGDVIFLGITNPSSEEYPNNQDISQSEIKSFLHEKGYTFPTLFDETGDLLTGYRISAFPTTFIINKNGDIISYVPGMMTKNIMKNAIAQALESSK